MRSSTIIAAVLLMAAATLSAQGWGPDQRLTNDPAESRTSYAIDRRCIAVSGANIHVVWYDQRDGNREISYKRSTDDGTTWGLDKRLSNTNDESWNPSIAVYGNNVHVVWDEYYDGVREIYYKRSTDNGVTWGPDVRLTYNPSLSFGSCVAVSGDTIHVVWHDWRDGNVEIYYKRSIDNGTTWGSDARLTNAVDISRAPMIAVSGNDVHVAWSDCRDGNYEIYYKRSTDNGSTWGSDTRLTNAEDRSEYSSIAVTGSNIHVVWTDWRDGNDEIYYKCSTDNGSTWGSDIRLTGDANNSRYPSVGAFGSNINVVWQDWRDENWEIYYKHSNDNGITWGSDERLTDAAFNSESPSVAVSGTNIHVAWCDWRDGNWEIYYKRYLGVLVIEAFVDFDPDKLNFASKGKWVTSYIELEEGYSVEDIDKSTVAITKIDGTELDPPLNREGPTGIGDHDEDGMEDLMVKFDRQELIDILEATGYEDGDEVELTIAGELTTGEAFEGSDVIEVLDKGMKDEPDEGGILSSGPLGGGGSTIEYSLPEPSNVRVSVYDASGRKVAKLVEEYQDAGEHALTWDGCDDAGRALPSGIYFLNFEAGKFSRKARLVILR